MGDKRFRVLVALLLVVTINFSSAELNLVITGTINSQSTDFYLKTNEYASAGYDGYDLEVPSFPESIPTLYSIISNKNLIIDNWPSSDREIIMAISIPSNPSGDLELSFGDIEDDFGINLYDCGDDEGCDSIISENTITGGATYEVPNEYTIRYFKLGIDYLYCGDGFCTSSESCSSCSNDCGECSSSSGGGGGGGGSGTTTIASGLQQLSKDEFKFGYKATLGVNQGFTFPIGSETHSLKVNSITPGAINITISSDPITLLITKDTSQLVDVNADGERDLNVSVLNIFSSGAEVIIKKYSDPIFQFLEADDNDEGMIEDTAEAIVGAKILGIPVIVFSLFTVGILMLIGGAVVLIIRAREPKKSETNYSLPTQLEKQIG